VGRGRDHQGRLGLPKLINDEEIVALYVSKGATFAEAYDYAVSGCTEARMPNRDNLHLGRRVHQLRRRGVRWSCATAA
jgi:hypothetical protein